MSRRDRASGTTKSFTGATLLDIAPTVLTLLGVPVPDDMDGRALTNILVDPPAVPERVASYEEPHPLDGMHRGLSAEETDPWAARQALEQLAALGYIELPDAADPEKFVAGAQWDRRWNLAQVYQSSSRSAEAIPLLRELLAEREIPEVRCRLAACLLAMGQPAEAAAMVEPLFAGNAFAPLARLIMGRAKLRLRENEEALRWLEPLCKQEAELPELSLSLGQVYLRLEMLPEAEAAFRRTLERDEDSAAAHDGLGVVLRRQGKYEDAVFEHMRAASLQHNRPRIHANLGIALARTGQVDWAIRAFEQASQLAPDEPFPHRCLARLYHGPKKDRVRARHHAARNAAVPQTPPGTGRRRSDGNMTGKDTGVDAMEPPCWITVVSGLPRSGTSLMMQMLAAGGIPPLTDATRLADASNPRGYLELEAVKRLKTDRSWLPQARGKAVKIIHLLLPKLAGAGAADALEFRVVMMRRPVAEVVASQRAMLARQGKASAAVPDAQLEKLFADQLMRVERWLEGRPEFAVCVVDYPALVADPAATAARLNVFLGGGLDEAAMVRAVDPALYREKR